MRLRQMPAMLCLRTTSSTAKGGVKCAKLIRVSLTKHLKAMIYYMSAKNAVWKLKKRISVSPAIAACFAASAKKKIHKESAPTANLTSMPIQSAPRAAAVPSVSAIMIRKQYPRP